MKKLGDEIGDEGQLPLAANGKDLKMNGKSRPSHGETAKNSRNDGIWKGGGGVGARGYLKKGEQKGGEGGGKRETVCYVRKATDKG